MDGSVIEGSFCKVWIKPDDTILSHTLYLTEDLYAHHIVDGYSYPGLHLGDQIVFRCRRLEETCFCEKLRQFWTDWASRSPLTLALTLTKLQNDVAITMNPEDQEFYLLETLPGIKARLLKEDFSDRAVFFFDLKWHYRDSLVEQHQILKDTLGSHYDPSYRDFLMFIHVEEFELENSRYIGEGSFGKAYCVPWKKPLNNFDPVKERPRKVALKISHLQHTRSSPAADIFFREVGSSVPTPCV